MPPNWPPPPEGWVPGPGWQPDPSWPAPPEGWNFWVKPSRWQLDGAVARAQSQHWTLRLGFGPVLAVIAVLGLEYLSLRNWHPHGLVRDIAFGIGSILHYAVAVLVIVLLGRRVSQQVGGWFAAFGWGRPKVVDLALGVGGAVAEFGLRAIAAIIMLIAVPALRHGDPNNVSLSNRPVAEVTTLIIVAVLIAPPIEELIFRGLLLRTLMRRIAFWPAALISTAIFAALHLYEVHGIASMVLLFVSIFVFGLGQCLLVRWTGRLSTSIVAHSATNLVGVLIALAARR